MFKNTASQKIVVYAWDSGNSVPKTGDAANITAYISKDGGAAAQSNDINPTELDSTNMPGFYYFDLTQAETNCDQFIISPASSTTDIVIEPQMVYTNPVNFTSMGIESDGDLTKVNALDGQTVQTGDVYSYLTSALTEEYGTAGAARKFSELLYEIKSLLTNFDIAGTLLTSYKLNGTDTAKTYTLDDNTNPSALEETT